MIKFIQLFIKFVCIFSVLSIISSCAYFKLKTLDSYEYDDKSIYTLLSKEYKLFAKSELYEMHDEIDANYFAYKALIAKNENKIYLENPNDWDIPNHAIEEAITYYNKITKIIENSISNYPDQASLMISGYDCWLEQLEENWQTEDIKKCKLKFLNNYKEILNLIDDETNLANTDKSISQQINKTKKVNKKKVQLNVIVYFKYDSFKLTKNELIKLEKVLDAANKFETQPVIITGHTDTKGSEKYNLILSNKRASFIKKYLQSKKIINTVITKGLGETAPMINTGNNKLEEKNRRAQIIIN